LIFLTAFALPPRAPRPALGLHPLTHIFITLHISRKSFFFPLPCTSHSRSMCLAFPRIPHFDVRLYLKIYYGTRTRVEAASSERAAGRRVKKKLQSELAGAIGKTVARLARVPFHGQTIERKKFQSIFLCLFIRASLLLPSEVLHLQGLLAVCGLHGEARGTEKKVFARLVRPGLTRSE
jgi:hypothetical protein